MTEGPGRQKIIGLPYSLLSSKDAKKTMAAEEKKNSSIPSEEESHAGLRGEGESEDDFVARAVRSWDNWSPVERLGFLEWFDLEYAIFSGRICREQTSTLGKKDIKFKRDNCVEAINVSQRLLTQGGGNRKNESVEISRISRLRALLDGIIEVFQKFQGRRRAAGQEHKAGAGSAHVCRSVTTIFKDREKQETQRTKSQLIAWLAKTTSRCRRI